MKHNHILETHQSGFRDGHSCATALMKMSDDILKALDKGDVAVLLLLDYSKAFDSLNHDILIYSYVLRYYGFSSDALKLIGSYFTDQEQMVSMCANVSESIEVRRCVPQGSILGLLIRSVSIYLALQMLFDTHKLMLMRMTHRCKLHFLKKISIQP